MTRTQRFSRASRIGCLIGSALLFVMGLFHGSGFFYITETIQASNVEDFLKEIVPVLFAHPSIHLLGLSALGILALFLKHDLRKLSWLLALLILIDALLAVVLGAMIPALLLIAAAICFVVAALKDKPIPVDTTL